MATSENVALINAPSKNQYFTELLPPVGLLYLASYLRKNGINVFFNELNVAKNWKIELARFLREQSFSIVGISSNVSNYNQTLEIASLVKTISKNTKVVVGGPHPSITPGEYMHPDIDYIIPFEGEQPMLDLVRTPHGHDPIEGVISCRKGYCDDQYNRIKRRFIHDLDELPFPAYDMIDLKPYYSSAYKKKPIVSMVTSRGCTYKCVFCSQTVSGGRWRARSPENVVAEMQWLHDIGVKEISIEDDNFTFDTKRIFKICDLIQSAKLKIVWQLGNGVRADRLTKELLRAMKDAGCWKLAIAPEVGDDETLKKVRKGMVLEQFRQAARWCRELHIVYYGYFSMGFPFETKDSMEQTIQFALELDPLLMDLSKIIPFPGTELYAKFPAKERYQENISYFYNSGNAVLDKMFKKAYLKFYLRPHKIIAIMRGIGFKQFLAFVIFGVRIILKKKGNNSGQPSIIQRGTMP